MKTPRKCYTYYCSMILCGHLTKASPGKPCNTFLRQLLCVPRRRVRRLCPDDAEPPVRTEAAAGDTDQWKGVLANGARGRLVPWTFVQVRPTADAPGSGIPNGAGVSGGGYWGRNTQRAVGRCTVCRRHERLCI